MDSILNFIKRIIPKGVLKKVLPFYHIGLASAAAFWHGYPSEKMIVIGVTGTNGKSTTTELIARVLEQPHPCPLLKGEGEKNQPHSQGGKTKVGFTSTVKFKVGDKEWLNDKKMTMVGRFQLQKLLHQMADAGCRYAVIETSSEGVKQFRHKAINYDYLVFTNLTPEHIESHGGFENYKKAKLELFKHLENSKRKKLGNREIKKLEIEKLADNTPRHSEPRDEAKNPEAREVNDINQDSPRQGKPHPDPPLKGEGEAHPPLQKGETVPKVIIVNGDDKYASEFLNFKVDRKIVYGIRPPLTPPCKGGETKTHPLPLSIGETDEILPHSYSADNIALTKNGTSFNVVPPSFEEGARGRFSEVGIEKFAEFGKSDTHFKLNLLGLFNIYNAMPAIIIGENEGLEMQEIKDALARVKNIPGRMEFIDEGQKFSVLVDYAPEPESMRKMYKTVQEINTPLTPLKRGTIGCGFNKIIHVLGSCGGGRDKARRPILGRIAGENADYVIITNEDPYDDDPMEIIEDVAGGAISKKQEIKKTIKQKQEEEIKKLEIKKLAANVLRHSEPRDEAKNPEAQEINCGNKDNTWQGKIPLDPPLGKGEKSGVTNVFKILDRREAIKKALQLAKPGDFVIITGKGAEQFICVADGKKIPWDDREVIREEIGKIKNSPNSPIRLSLRASSNF